MESNSLNQVRAGMQQPSGCCLCLETISGFFLGFCRFFIFLDSFLKTTLFSFTFSIRELKRSAIAHFYRKVLKAGDRVMW